ncbi:cysteinyl leukotriene receptor 1-like [Scleropages formosus]|uniref:Cysteinyl leukotriene receptor 1 n=1 Tax=Scleropages formosus TaxID=113540 RepID=A0A0P7T9H8_SCLFO|nr:cysteinyl leukotriene receptor 1 [Scleropages formosus]XP_018592713.1 cysteinyl leukotriene receptor 1 [Scleropages formosus]KPP57579.1 cysteinyl leukotriene receptor 1-like [Scleropages formosus]
MDPTNSTFRHGNITPLGCDSIDDFRNKVYSTVYSIITVFGLVGNGFALFVLMRTPNQRSAFHIYMLNLAVSDLLCVSTLPLRVLYYVNKGQWNLGDFLCRISSYALYVNLYCSVFFMMAMSCTRFLAIVFPVQNLKLVNERKARFVCVAVWIFICATSSPFLMSGTHIDPLTNKTKCFEPPEREGSLKKLVMLNYFSLVVGFIIPFLVILVCYAGIIHTLMTGSSSMKKQKQTRTKAIRMIIIVMLAFLVSFMPYHIQRTVHLQIMNRKEKNCEVEIFMQKSVVVTLCLAAANSCFDPMLYFFSGENFRRRFSTFRKTSVGSISQRRQRMGCGADGFEEEEDKLQDCNGPTRSQAQE